MNSFKVGQSPNLIREFYQHITTLSEIQSFETVQIRFEEKYSIIIIWITDPHGDCHSFELKHEGVSKDKALQILKDKQNELQVNPDQKPALTTSVD